MLTIINTTDEGGKKVVEELRRKLALDAGTDGCGGSLRDDIRKILGDVRDRGDAAVREYTKKFDGVDIPAERLRVGAEEIEQAYAGVPKELIAAATRARDNIEEFQSAILQRSPEPVISGGKRVGLRYAPVASAGVYVPAGSAPLASTLLMTAVPALVAGVARVVVVSPPRSGGDIHPSILAVCKILGIEEVYRIGGVQAVAALAFGTETVRTVDKIVGPGNRYVQAAKREVADRVGIDMFAGPSEVLILADDSAPAQYIAADMLSQVEHEGGSAVLVTDSDALASAVRDEIEQQASAVERKEGVAEGLANRSAIIVTNGRDEAVEIANDFAPEHMEVMLREVADRGGREAVLSKLTNAGAIFLGPFAPVALGDYIAGPSHTLPTGGTARFASGLSANDFLKATSIIEYDADALAAEGPDAVRLAETEGLDAHARSIRMRIEKKGK